MTSHGAKIRIGIVGCGKVADEHHLPAIKRLPDVRITALADTDRGRLQSMGRRYGIRRRFVDYHDLIQCDAVDAVAILTPTGSHAEIALSALAAGKHVLIEKPLALTLAQCDQLIAAGSKSQSKVMVAFNLRWHRLVRRARHFVLSGALGKVRAIRSVYSHLRLQRTVPVWHRKWESGGGVLFNEGVHHFDLWRYLTGAEVIRLFAYGLSSDIYNDETAVTSAVLSNAALASSVFSYSTSPNSEVEIYGEAGRLYLSCYRYDGFEFFPSHVLPGDVGHRLQESLKALKELPDALVARKQGGDFEATFTALWQHFIDCIQRDKTPECTLVDGKHAIETALGARRSMQTCREISITAASNRSALRDRS